MSANSSPDLDTRGGGHRRDDAAAGERAVQARLEEPRAPGGIDAEVEQAVVPAAEGDVRGPGGRADHRDGRVVPTDRSRRAPRPWPPVSARRRGAASLSAASRTGLVAASTAYSSSGSTSARRRARGPRSAPRGRARRSARPAPRRRARERGPRPRRGRSRSRTSVRPSELSASAGLTTTGTHRVQRRRRPPRRGR